MASVKQYNDSNVENSNSFEVDFVDPVEEHSRFRNDFEELSLLDKGGFGLVMKATNKLDKQMYAVKIVKLCPKFEENEGLTREAKVLAKLNHPNVVRYFASWVEKGFRESSLNQEGDGESFGGDEVIDVSQLSNISKSDSDVVTSNSDSNLVNSRSKSPLLHHLFIQMELCSYTLRIYLDYLYLDHEDVRCLSCGILNGLSYIHHLDLIHRDLNPNNIFVDSNRNIKIGDFGLARLIAFDGGFDNTPLSQNIGTPAYSAPEINTNNYDKRVDYYSFGIILFEMVYPMNSGTERAKVLTEMRKDACKLPNDFLKCGSLWHKKVIEAQISHSPDKRFSPEEVLELSNNYSDESFSPMEFSVHGVFDPYKKEVSLEVERTEYAGYSDPDFTEVKNICATVKRIEKVFKKHGASFISGVQFPIPCSAEGNSIQLMPSDNLAVVLSRNARKNFAHNAVQNNIQHIVRYETLKDHSSANSKPSFVCDFDIVTSGQDKLHNDAKALSVLLEVVEDTTNNLITISHTDIDKVILLSVGVQEDNLAIALKLVGENDYQGLNQLGGINFVKLQKILNIRGKPEHFKVQLISHLGADYEGIIERATENIQNILLYCQDSIGVSTGNVIVGLKWCGNVHNCSGVLFTAVCAHKDERKEIVIADGGHYDILFKSHRGDSAEDQGEGHRASGVGITVYPDKLYQIHGDFSLMDLVVVTCQRGSIKEDKVIKLCQKLRTADLHCREVLDFEPSQARNYMVDKTVLCLVEYLPGDFVKVSHKNLYYISISEGYQLKLDPNQNPPSIRIEVDRLLPELLKIQRKLQNLRYPSLATSRSRSYGKVWRAASDAGEGPATPSGQVGHSLTQDIGVLSLEEDAQPPVPSEVARHEVVELRHPGARAGKRSGVSPVCPRTQALPKRRSCPRDESSPPASSSNRGSVPPKDRSGTRKPAPESYAAVARRPLRIINGAPPQHRAQRQRGAGDSGHLTSCSPPPPPPPPPPRDPEADPGSQANASVLME